MSKIKPNTISIIGGAGQMGRKFERVFKERGYRVLISDLGTKFSNKDVASLGDVVIITVPIGETEKVLLEITPFLKKGPYLRILPLLK